MTQRIIITQKTQDKIPLYLKEAVSYLMLTPLEKSHMKHQMRLFPYRVHSAGYSPNAGMISHLLHS